METIVDRHSVVTHNKVIMLRIVYKVKKQDVDSEVAWLKSMFIFPSVDKMYNWLKSDYEYYIGMIADESILVSLKLRHSEIQTSVYRK